MTTRAARRSPTRPIPATSGSKAAGTLVLMDTGRPPPLSVSQEAHAGCLSFELSVQAQPHRGQLRVADHEPRKLAAGGARDGRAFHGHVQRHVLLPVRRIRPGQAHAARRAHDRRAAHHRGRRARSSRWRARCAPRTTAMPTCSTWSTIARCCCPPTDRRLDGEDVFTPAAGDNMPAGRDQFALRFHLHPSVKANRLADGHSAMLMMPNKDVWTFNAYEDRIDIEESVYLAGPDGPAPHRADRDLRPRPQSDARAMDASPRPPATRARRDRTTSRNCRCDGAAIAAVRQASSLRSAAGAAPANCSSHDRLRDRRTRWPNDPPHRPRAALRFRQDRADRFRPRARGLRHRARLDRRHPQGAARSRACGARRAPSSPAFPR